MRTLTEQKVNFKTWIHDDTIQDTEIDIFLKSAYNTLHTIAPQNIISAFICTTTSQDTQTDDIGNYLTISTQNLLNYEIDKPIKKTIKNLDNLRIYIQDDNALVKICNTIQTDDITLWKLPAYIDDAILFLSIAYYYQSIQNFNLVQYFEKKAKDVMNFTFNRSNYL